MNSNQEGGNDERKAQAEKSKPLQATVEKTREKVREKTREKIMRLIQSYQEITTAEIAKKSGVTQKGVEWNISKLKKERLIKRVGPDKGGHWEVAK